MYAIVEIQGKQYKVRRNAIVNVDKLDLEDKAKIEFDKVLLCSDGTQSLIGQPYLKDVKVEAEVVGQVKGQKVIAFKFKRRKRYHKKIGHRQKYTALRILNIQSPITPAAPPKEKIEEKKEEKVEIEAELMKKSVKEKPKQKAVKHKHTKTEKKAVSKPKTKKESAKK